MNKFKFLSYAAIAAFMTVGFTSCEKEDFKVEAPVIPEVPEFPEFPEIPEAAPAVVTINPSVIAFINGTAKNITNDKETDIQFTIPTAAEDGTIPETEVKITVKYNANLAAGLTQEVTATEIVKVPKLSRGMCCALTPTIVLSVIAKEDPNEIVMSGNEKDESTKDNVEATNKSEYFYSGVTKEIKYKTGAEVKNIDWKVAELKEDKAINDAINALNTVKEETKKFDNLTVCAQSKTVITVISEIKSLPYSIKKKYNVSRATEEKIVEVVTFDLYKYGKTEFKVETNVGLDGTPHGGAGHGHGHAHGDAGNAGGGIVWGE